MEQAEVTKAVRKILTGSEWHTFKELMKAAKATNWQIRAALHECYEDRGFDLDSDLARRHVGANTTKIYYRIYKGENDAGIR